MRIEIDGERFDVSLRDGPYGQHAYDFSWLNGPHEGTYGFTIGTTSNLDWEISREKLENEAKNFVHNFFAPDGTGASDFPDFVASRLKNSNSDKI